MCPY
jgi:hypothetical protein